MQIPIYEINNQEVLFNFCDDPSIVKGYEIELEIHKMDSYEYESLITWTFKNNNQCLAWVNWLEYKMDYFEENHNELEDFIVYLQTVTLNDIISILNNDKTPD